MIFSKLIQIAQRTQKVPRVIWYPPSFSLCLAKTIKYSLWKISSFTDCDVNQCNGTILTVLERFDMCVFGLWSTVTTGLRRTLTLSCWTSMVQGTSCVAKTSSCWRKSWIWEYPGMLAHIIDYMINRKDDSVNTHNATYWIQHCCKLFAWLSCFLPFKNENKQNNQTRTYNHYAYSI